MKKITNLLPILNRLRVKHAFTFILAFSLFGAQLYASNYSDIDLQLNASYETCDGSCDGNVSVNASGGSGGFTYLWNTGDDFVVVEDACAGTYSVTVTDSDGTTAVGSIELELSPEGIWLMLSGTDVTSCAGGANGTAHVSVMTGEAPYTIVWSDGQTGEDITGLSAGTYSVTVTDANGCSNSDQIEIEDGSGSNSIDLEMNASYETCAGSSDANASVNASGGSGGYTYLWSNGETFVVNDNIGAGTYTVTVTDDEGCSAVGSIEVELSPEGIWLMLSGTDVTCAGGSNGTAHVSVMTGVAPYTIVWSDGQMGEDITGLSAGTYSVTVTDANGCSNTESIEIEDGNGTPIELDMNASFETCAGSCDANASVNASGGSGGYTYLWSNGETFVVNDNLCAGTYTVTVTDDEGCSAVGSIEVELSPEGIWLMTSSTDATCEGNDGTAHVSVMTGVAPFTIEWSDGQSGEDVTDLAPGTYTVTVTDANGCSATDEVTIGGPDPIIITVDNVTDATCGENNGSISISVSGGNPDYTFQWSGSAANTEDLSGLGAGDYFVTVTDEDGCTAVEGPINVGQSSPIVITVDDVNDSDCDANNGSINISVSGGNPGYTFDWSGNAGNTEDLSGLAPGSYTVIVTDSDGCTATEGPITVGEGPCCEIPVIASVVVIEATCGDADGSACIEMVGNNDDFTFDWDTSEGTPNSTGNCRTDLPSGTYTVTITGDPNCPSIVETFTVGNADFPPVSILSQTPATCELADGTVTMSEPGFEYIWCNGETGSNPTNLPSGPCVVQITDPSTGCTDFLTVVIGEVNPLMAEAEVNDNPDCGMANGSVTINVTGGSGNYTFAWSNGGTGQTLNNLTSGSYCVTVTDNGPTGCTAVACFVLVDDVAGATIVVNEPVSTTCAGSDDATVVYDVTYDPGFAQPATIEIIAADGSVATNGSLSPGNYCIVITDANGCAAGESCFTVVEPSQIDLDIAINDSCPSPGITIVSVTGGNGGYTFEWSTGAMTQNITDLQQGLYSVTVTDINGCTAVASNLPITVDCSCPPILVQSVVVVETTCGNAEGIATIEMVGDNAGYSYDWSPNVGTANTLGNSRTDLPAGIYSVTITDLDEPNCPPIVEEFSIGNSDFPIVTLLSTTPATCNESNGTAVMSEINFEYLWCNGATGNNPTNLPAGPCIVQITDPATGCVDYQTVIIGTVNPLMVDIVINNQPDCGMANGSVTANVSGGSTNYSYVWSNGGTGQTIDNLASGSYCVTVTDNGPTGCVSVECFVLTDNVPSATIVVTEPVSTTCIGSADATVVYDITYDPGFAQPAVIEILDANGNAATNGSLSGGTYCIVVTDANGCAAGQSCFDVVEPSQIDLDIAIDDNCPSPSITVVETIGGTGPYTYDWEHIAGTDNPQDISDLDPGLYSLTVTDANGCTAVVNDLPITAECNCPPILVQSVVVVETTCGNAEGIATIDMVGDNAGYSYDWSPNVGTANTVGNSRTDLPAGIYSVTITDLDEPNCPPIVEEFSIGNSDFPPVTLVATTPATCNESNGSAEMSEPGFEYLWCNGATGNNPTNLPAGACIVQITDPATGCIDYQTVVIGTVNPLMVDVVVNNQPDCGMANGSVTANVTGGSGDYAYEWSNGAMTQTADNLASGSYCVTVTDNGPSGCVSVECFVLTDNVPGATIVVTEPVSTNCVGSADATVVYDITYDPGFAQPAVIEILDANGNAAANDSLSAGTYCIVVTDANGCVAGQSCFDVVEPSQIDLDIAIHNTCDPTPGIEVVETIGGTGPYLYDWFDLPGDDNPEDRPDLETGLYHLTVTDVNGCSASINDLMVIDTCACPPMIISSVIVVESECGESTGQATVNVVDAGSVSYDYDWNIGNDLGPSVIGLEAGTYAVTITNVARPECNIIEEFSVGNSNGPEATNTPTASLCGANTGSVTFSNSTFTYTWADGDFTQIRTDLAAGTYFVTITDPNDPDCVDVQTVVIEEMPSFSLSHTVNAIPDCGETNGSVTIMPSAAGNYSYSWGGDGTVNNLGSGAYQVTVTDNDSGCTATTSFILIDNVPNNSVVFNPESFVSCPGSTDGTIEYTEIPGVTITIQDDNGEEVTNGSLAPGTYCLIASDVNGCISGGDCIEVRSPDQIDVDVAVFDEVCGDPGSIQLVEVLGGMGGYTYEWSAPIDTAVGTSVVDLGAGPYSFTVTDVNGCSVSETVSVQDDPDALSVNIDGDATICGTPNMLSYGGIGETFQWTDADGIVLSDTTFTMIDTVGMFYLEVTNGECVELDSILVSPGELTVQIDDVTACFEASEILNEDGNSDLIYDWSPSDDLDDASSPSPTVTTNDSTIFTVMISDSLGVCHDTVEVAYNVIDEVELALAAEGGPVYCSADSVNLIATSNATDNNINWYDTPDLSQIVNTGSLYENANPVGFGESTTYYVESNISGCTSLDTITISNFGLPFELLGDSTVCEDETVFLRPEFFNSVDLTGAMYEWSGNGILNDNLDEVEVGPSVGDNMYTLTIDNGFCEETANFNINVPDLSGNATAFPPEILLSETSGLSTLTNGGTNLTYLWEGPNGFSSTDPTPDVQPEETTTYTVTITDEDTGCVDVRTVTVTVITICDEPYIFFPNAFSPNNDGYNDVLLLRGQDVTEVFFAIYDRWGEKVFESNSQNEGWDGTFGGNGGKELCSDVYGFYLRVRCGNGEEYYKQGNVTLFR